MTKTVFVTDYSDAVKAFVASGLFTPERHFGEAVGLGFANETEGLIAGFVFHNWEPAWGLIEVSGYSTRRDWVNKDHLRALFAYPFDQLNLRLVTARHSERNTRVRRSWNALGAAETVVPEIRGPSEAEVIAVLTKEAWLSSKFMRPSDG